MSEIASQDDSELFSAAEEITSYVDRMVSTMNPAIAEIAPPPRRQHPHICNKPYSAVDDFNMTLLLHANDTLYFSTHYHAYEVSLTKVCTCNKFIDHHPLHVSIISLIVTRFSKRSHVAGKINYFFVFIL